MSGLFNMAWTNQLAFGVELYMPKIAMNFSMIMDIEKQVKLMKGV